MRQIPLHGARAAGRLALVDDDDYDLVSQHRWACHEWRSGNGRMRGPYARALVNRRWVLMHKLITGWPKTDHKDHDGLNNQRLNLRPATTAQNNHNQRPRLGTSSVYKGVTWNARNRKWQAAIKTRGNSRYLGLFTREEDAAAAYDNAAREIQGDYAYLNSEQAR